MVIVLNAAIVSIAMVWNIRVIQGVLTRWPGFLLRDCRWLFLGPSLLPWMPIRSRHCCEEPERVLVWIVIAATVTKIVEGCVYFRRRYHAIFGMLSEGEFEHSALCSASLSSLSSNTMTIKQLIRPCGGQGIRAWTPRTRVERSLDLVPGVTDVFERVSTGERLPRMRCTS